MFSAGSGLLALAARRSRRWVTVLLVTAALVSMASADPALMAAQDGATGVLVAAMHLAAGATFLVTTSVVVRRAV